MREKYPIDAILTFVSLAGFAFFVSKCSSDGFSATTYSIWYFLANYLLPFVVVSGINFYAVIEASKSFRTSRIYSGDFDKIAAGTAIFSAAALVLAGIPGPKVPWSYAVWAAILFGAPVLIWAYAKNHVRADEGEFENALVTPLKERVMSLERALSTAKWRENQTHEELEALKKQIIKAEEEKSPDQKAGEVKKKGLLDSDDF